MLASLTSLTPKIYESTRFVRFLILQSAYAKRTLRPVFVTNLKITKASLKIFFQLFVRPKWLQILLWLKRSHAQAHKKCHEMCGDSKLTIWMISFSIVVGRGWKINRNEAVFVVKQEQVFIVCVWRKRLSHKMFNATYEIAFYMMNNIGIISDQLDLAEEHGRLDKQQSWPLIIPHELCCKTLVSRDQWSLSTSHWESSSHKDSQADSFQ